MQHPTDNTYIPESLIEAIFPILMKNGFKATTMDKIASSLSISKRTLYEIFGSKDNMLIILLRHYHEKNKKAIVRLFHSSNNVMESLYRTIIYHEEMMKQVSPQFFRDMDSYNKKFRSVYEKDSKCLHNDMMIMIRSGIDQGVFRKDVDYRIAIRMFSVQMESLKRMEELLPPDVTIFEAYRSISMGFLRSIASPKGMDILDKLSRSEQHKI